MPLTSSSPRAPERTPGSPQDGSVLVHGRRILQAGLCWALRARRCRSYSYGIQGFLPSSTQVAGARVGQLPPPLWRSWPLTNHVLEVAPLAVGGCPGVGGRRRVRHRGRKLHRCGQRRGRQGLAMAMHSLLASTSLFAPSAPVYPYTLAASSSLAFKLVHSQLNLSTFDRLLTLGKEPNGSS